VQAGDFAFEPAEPDDDLVELFALRRLLGANRAQHPEYQIGLLVAHLMNYSTAILPRLHAVAAIDSAPDAVRSLPECRRLEKMMAFDLLIKNGTVVDGSGMARYRADVGVARGRIVEIGRIRAPAEATIDAEGLVVAPGFIDGHTHMDAQVAWDPIGSCSCWHGVTSVVMGNCGFALAPCKPADREWFARCLTAVEDIPTEAMLAGIEWNWETFPEYFANVERLPKAINYGMYIGHSALRMYVMGRRALEERAGEDDLRRMGALVGAALRAGALGLSTSRATTHVTPDGTPVASRIADWREIDRLVAAMAECDAGILQVGPDISGGAAQRACLGELRRIALASGRPVMFAMLASRQGIEPNRWDYQLGFIDETVALGGRMFGQATTRSINAIFSLKSYLPFDVLPGWQKVRALPLDAQRRRLADPELRRQLVAEEATMKPRDQVLQGGGAATTDPRKPDYDNLFALAGVDWDEPSVGELARRHNRHPVEVMLDLALANPDQLFVQPIVNEDPTEVLGMLRHQRTLATFSDSGAHVCQEMGSSLQTHLLSYWVRNKEAFTLEAAVRMLSFDNASAWELPDRGLVRPGYRADLVVFDAARVKPRLPTVERDLPGGARRLVQKADGIRATIVNGVVALENGEPTGRTPGQMLRGAPAQQR
jgi:N-acyl-D-aspartate/D-glutamate deacylase